MASDRNSTFGFLLTTHAVIVSSRKPNAVGPSFSSAWCAPGATGRKECVSGKCWCNSLNATSSLILPLPKTASCTMTPRFCTHSSFARLTSPFSCSYLIHKSIWSAPSRLASLHTPACSMVYQLVCCTTLVFETLLVSEVHWYPKTVWKA